MSPRTPGQAITYARKHRSYEPGFCLQYVRIAYGIAPRFLTAALAWNGAEFKHPVKTGMQVPRGVPVYWTGGSKGQGHIAIATGNGQCWSTDAGGAGVVAKVKIDDLTSRWGINFKGWAEDVNGVRVLNAGEFSRPDLPPIRLKQVLPDPRDDVRAVQRALKKRMPQATKGLVIDGLFGAETKKAYAAWQRRCGFTGPAADGIPGKHSLQRLGFVVK